MKKSYLSGLRFATVDEFLRIAVMGAGGVGGYFGGLLAKAGEDVWFVARGQHMQAMREHGLEVRSLAGDFSISVKATDDPEEIGRTELVIFCVKTYHTEEALTKLTPAVGVDTVILPLQNGVESADKIGKSFGYDKVLGGAAYIESFIATPGVIEQRSKIRKIDFGELDGSKSRRAGKVLEVFSRAGIDCQLRTDIRKALWEKLVWIAGGAMTALTRSTIGEVLGFSLTREMFVSVMREVKEVALATGTQVDSDIVEKTLKFAEGLDPRMKTSMLRDVENGKRLEIDAINGAVARFGAMHSMQTPVNSFIYSVLKLEDQKNKLRLKQNG